MEDRDEKPAPSVGGDTEFDADTAEPSSEAESKMDHQALTKELAEAVERCRKTTTELERLKLQTKTNYTAGQEEIAAAIAHLHTLLEEKKNELFQELEEFKEIKLEAFTEKETMFTVLVGQATRLLADPESTAQDLLCHGPSLISSLSSPISPHPAHLTAHPALGFCSNMKEHTAQALSLGMWVCGEDVKVGERMGVTAVGGLQCDGSFWVRKVHSDPWRQEYALQHMSSALCEVPQSCEALTECAPGQLCVAQFSQDSRWYRAVVVATPKPGVAKFFFLDHGGSEEASVTSLYPLTDKFRALPFQMIHVKLTNDPSLDFNTREMRWCFTDHTHKKTLVADILSQCEVDMAVPLYLIHLEDHSQTEPFDVGQLLVTAAKVKPGVTSSKFNSRDIRFKDKRLPPAQTTPTAATTTAEVNPPPPETAPTPPPSDTHTTAAPTNDTGDESHPLTAADMVSTTVPPPANEASSADAASSADGLDPTASSADGLDPTASSADGLDPTASSADGLDSPASSADGLDPTASSADGLDPTASSADTLDLPSANEASSADGLSDSDMQAGAVTSLNSLSQTPHSTPSPISQSQTTQLSHSQSAPSSQAPVAQNSLSAISTQSQLTLPHPHSAVESVRDSGPNSIPQPVCSDTAPDEASPNSSQAETSTASKLKPLQLSETESVLLSNEILSTDDITADDAINSLHPRVVTGARLCVEVMTELTPDGHFWCQLLSPSAEREERDSLLEELRVAKARVEGEAFTPVFYNEGDLCAACFSEDDEWYRARIERVIPGAPHTSFIVRYLDFGNGEERQQHQVMVLGSEFKLRPPNAIHCSIATSDHTSFTLLECEKFEELTSQDGIIIEVLSVSEDGMVAKVRLLQSLPDKDDDITDAIYTASEVKSSVKKISSRQWSSSNDMEDLVVAHVSDWASHMEDEQEDQQEDSVFLTLPGHESSREATPSLRETTPTNQRVVTPIPTSRGATPTRQRETTPIRKAATPIRTEATPTNQREATPIRKEATPTSGREATPIRTEATPTIGREVTAVKREATPTTRAVSPVKQREAPPTTRREASPITRTSKNATTPREATPTQQEAPPTQRDPGPTQWVPLKATGSFLQRVANHDHTQSSSSGRQARLDVNRARHTIFSSLGAKSLPRSAPSEDIGLSRGSGRVRHSKVDQRKLYVKGMSLDKTDSEIKELFGRYGEVIDIDPHTTDATKLYVVMDAKGAEEAITKMNGYQISPGHKLVVERYRARSPSPPPLLPTPSSLGADILPDTEHVRLFVKNISADHNPASLKTLFSRYGRVSTVLPDPKRRNVAYVYMDVEGGAKAISNLHGKAISKNGKPLVVELSYEPKTR